MDNKKDIEELISDLSQDLKPVRNVMHPFLHISPWIIIAFAYMAGVVHFIGLRMDWADKMHEAGFVFELILTSGIAVSAAYAAGWLAIPDMQQKKWLLAVPVTLLGAFIAFEAAAMLTHGIHLPGISWHHCFSDALLMGFVPLATLSMLVRRGATTKPRWLAFMSILAVGALGWGALRLTCSADGADHTLFFHFLPFVLCAALLGALARRLYRW